MVTLVNFSSEYATRFIEFRKKSHSQNSFIELVDEAEVEKTLGIYNDQNNVAILAIDKNKIIGQLFWIIRDGELCLELITVLAEYRGKGVGLMLIYKVFEEQKRTGLPILLSANKNNHHAIKFYEQLGFKRIYENKGWLTYRRTPNNEPLSKKW